MLTIGTNKENEVYMIQGFSGYKNGERYFKVQSQKTGKVLSVSESNIKEGSFSFGDKAKTEVKTKKQTKKYVQSNLDNIKLLSLDMATIKTGYAVHYGETLVEHSYIKANGDLHKRMLDMLEDILKLVEKHKINMVVIEDIFLKSGSSFRDVDVFKKLAGIQYLVTCNLHARNIKFELITASEWRSACGIKGKTRAKAKEQAMAIGESYNAKTEDESEAILIGVGWINKNKKLEV